MEGGGEGEREKDRERGDERGSRAFRLFMRVAQSSLQSRSNIFTIISLLTAPSVAGDGKRHPLLGLDSDVRLKSFQWLASTSPYECDCCEIKRGLTPEVGLSHGGAGVWLNFKRGSIMSWEGWGG